MNEAKCGTEVSRSEFEAILGNFRQELSKLDENSGVIMDKACTLRDFREPNTEEGESQASQDCIIGELEQCIRRMRGYNNRLNEVKNGLIKFVG